MSWLSPLLDLNNVKHFLIDDRFVQGLIGGVAMPFSTLYKEAEDVPIVLSVDFEFLDKV